MYPSVRDADDVLAWLARCSSALKPGGLIVVKENLTTIARFEMCAHLPVKVPVCLMAFHEQQAI
jgi:AdoMet dependent proline di-methyltransferase